LFCYFESVNALSTLFGSESYLKLNEKDTGGRNFFLCHKTTPK